MIDERNDDSKFRKSKPDCHEFRTVFHEQRNFVAMLKALLVENVRNTIFKFIEL